MSDMRFTAEPLFLLREFPVQTAGSSSEAQNDDGIEQVTLKVWAEEAAFDTMNEMIESFKEAHRGEAEFNITIEQNLDSKTKDVILGDVHNGADVFPLPDDQLSAMAAAGVLSAILNQEEVSAANTAESVAAASINGVMYAYPMTANNGYFLYYNITSRTCWRSAAQEKTKRHTRLQTANFPTVRTTLKQSQQSSSPLRPPAPTMRAPI